MAFQLALFAENLLSNETSRSVLYRLRQYGVTNVIVSDTPEGRIHNHVEVSEFGDLVQEILPYGQDKEVIILKTLARHRVAVRDALYVDDRAIAIRQAKRTGVITLAFTGGRDSAASLFIERPHYLIDSLTDVGNIAHAQLPAY